MAQIYDRPVSELMRDAAAELTYPTKPSAVIAWFGAHYPRIKANTVRAHVKGLTDGDPSRHHYAWLVDREPLFVRDASGLLARYTASDVTDVDATEETYNEPRTGRLEFALEAYLEEFLLTNWQGIDWGRPLELWDSPTGESGHQLITPV